MKTWSNDWPAGDVQGILDSMAYPPRIELEGFAYHVTAHGVHGCPIFRDEDDRTAFLRLLLEESRRSEWTCLEYSLMGTHYHVLLTLQKPTLSSGFQRLQSRYARAYNRRHARRGALWDRRFNGALIETDSHLLEAVRYVALNAFRANLCTAPEDWPWASYGSTIGSRPGDPLVDHDRVLGLFGRDRGRAQQRLRSFVEERDPRTRRSQIPL